MHFHLRGCHALWPAFPDRSINTFLSLFSPADSCCRQQRPADDCGPATPDSPCGSSGLGCSDFARHYFRNHGCFLLLRVLRWFTSPGLPVHPMDSDARKGCSHPLGFPIRTSPDHSLLAAPRSFSQLITSFIAYLRLGIHTHALSSLTIKSTSHSRPTVSPDRLAENTCVRYFFALTLPKLVFCNARQIFSFQRSRLLQQSVERKALRTADCWWAQVESNHRPHPYQGCALAI